MMNEKGDAGMPKVSLKMIGPGFAMYRVELPAGLPAIDDPRAGMFRVLGQKSSAALTALPDDERDAVLMSLAGTYLRASYHWQRFVQIVELLEERRIQVGATVAMDTAGRFALFEAAA